MNIVFVVENHSNENTDHEFEMDMDFFPSKGDIIVIDGLSYSVRMRYTFIDNSSNNHVDVRYVVNLIPNN